MFISYWSSIAASRHDRPRRILSCILWQQSARMLCVVFGAVQVIWTEGHRKKLGRNISHGSKQQTVYEGDRLTSSSFNTR